MAQTEAQRRASEANLRKGNKRAYSRKPAPEAEPEAEEEPDPGKRTYRAKAPAKPARKPAARKRPAAPAPEPAKPKSGGGFLGGLLDGLR